MAVPAPGRVCDSHVHVFDPVRFPYAVPRRFTPGYAGVDRLRQHLDAIGASRVVLVQPSVYGHDHRCLVDALGALRGAGRGVAVLASDATAAEVAVLHASGVRAARLNLVVDGIADVSFAREQIALVAAQIAPGWHIQLHVSLGLVEALAPVLHESAQHFVLDHLGLPSAPDAVDSIAWKALIDLVAAGKMTVKLSAPYLSGGPQPPYPTLKPLVKSLAQANPAGIVWGTNWPHTQGTARAAAATLEDTEPFREVDDQVWLHTCAEWLTELDLPISILDDNAERLYAF